MATKIVKSWTVLCDLIEYLVGYSETLQELPYGAEKFPGDEKKAVSRKFPLYTPQQKSDAIIAILFGEETVRKRRGNRSFRANDEKLMFQMKAEMKATGKTREALLDKYVEKAEKRKYDTDHESVRERIISVYQSLPDINPADYDYGDDAGLGFEDMYDDELSLIRNWLAKYEKERSS
ncbi:hypothetical protein GQF03_16475 [Sneathiella chungangensis]|uniref:Uncharacterized protein n=1 Tax=Sneathiella chungangensis TaxID=1418234 RepID=A0A845MJZ6_9PROT|nr:hypothetical protein [Sneathiella chungangensis]MZR23932.1 hypothetical protein [Sneathiella chungangensis]